jgi:hypothetical protein
MHHEAHTTNALLQRGFRPRTETRGRNLRPFHPATPTGATHDLLVMNYWPEAAGTAPRPAVLEPEPGSSRP